MFGKKTNASSKLIGGIGKKCRCNLKTLAKKNSEKEYIYSI